MVGKGILKIVLFFSGNFSKTAKKSKYRHPSPGSGKQASIHNSKPKTLEYQLGSWNTYMICS